MPINILNILTEISLYLLFFGITFSNSATEIFVVSIIVFFLIRRILEKNFKPPKTRLNIMLYALCLIVFITFLRSAYFSESIRGFIRVPKFIFLYFALIEFFTKDEKRIKRAFWVIMAIACFTFLNGIFQSFFGFDIVRHREITKADYLYRMMASFVHPNDFAAYIIFTLPLSFCFLCKDLIRRQRAFLVMVCLLGAYCLLETSSRAAWLGFIIGLFLYFFYYKRKLSFIMPLAALLLISVTPHGFDRLKNIFSIEQNAVWERAQLWKGTWNMVKVHPLLGFGVNTFSRYFLQYKPADYPDIRYTHNSYLQMWSEIGIIGLTAFLSVIFTVLVSAMKGLKEKIRNGGVMGLIFLGSISGYIAALIQSGFDTNLFSLVQTTLLWVMTAYIMSINKMLEEKK